MTHNQNVCLAVLPLQVLSDDPQVEMFCHGLVMDLITDLSRFRSFHIIAHESSSTLHPDEQPNSPKLDPLHLDYLIKGMARFQSGTLLLNVQLLQVQQNRLVWAEKFSGELDALFRIEEQIVEKTVASLQQFVEHDLLRAIRNKHLTNMSAYECWLKGYQEVKKGTIEADQSARRFFKQALDLDPHFARAYTGMSLSYFNEWSCQLWSRWEVSRNGAFEWAQKALDLDEWDHVSNAILGRIYLFNAEYEKAEHFLRKSLRINPNDGETLVPIAIDFVYLGYLDEARGLLERVQHLNPARELALPNAFIHFEMGEFEQAIALAEQHEAGKGWVDFPAFQAAACFLRGNLDKMRRHWQSYLHIFSEKINGGKPADTQTALEWMMNVNPYRGQTQLKPFWEFMAEAAADTTVVEKTAPQPVQQRNRFSLHGDTWTMAFGGKQVQLVDLKGYHDLARLLAEPNQPIHCTDLMGAQTLEPGEELFDDKARAAYHQRILKLQQALEEAEASQDAERLGTLQEEYDQLLDHLSQATGKGGKARKVAGSVEKCRSAVTWRIRSAIKKIADSHQTLGKHLAVSIKTGVFCEYTPEHEMDWIL